MPRRGAWRCAGWQITISRVWIFLRSICERRIMTRGMGRRNRAGPAIERRGDGSDGTNGANLRAKQDSHSSRNREAHAETRWRGENKCKPSVLENSGDLTRPELQ